MTDILLDTHIALWAVSADRQLRPRARDAILVADRVCVSVVAIWEIAIKHALRRGRHQDIVVSGHEARLLFDAAGFDILPVTAQHAAAVDDLPSLHGDPFDRMLIAQALTEPMRLLTSDAALTGYGALVTMV